MPTLAGLLLARRVAVRDLLQGQGHRVSPRRHKYGAVATVIDGVRFSSKAEARRYQELVLLQQAGHINALELQPRYPLEVLGANGEITVIGNYVADFQYWTCKTRSSERDTFVVEDVKGFKTPLYRWKKKHTEAQHGIEITEI